MWECRHCTRLRIWWVFMDSDGQSQTVIGQRSHSNREIDRGTQVQILPHRCLLWKGCWNSDSLECQYYIRQRTSKPLNHLQWLEEFGMHQFCHDVLTAGKRGRWAKWFDQSNQDQEWWDQGVRRKNIGSRVNEEGEPVESRTQNRRDENPCLTAPIENHWAIELPSDL